MTQRRDSGLHANTDWFGVEVRHLAALAAVAHEGSFGGAARRLGYTQSAISGQIATLERIVGVRMLNRLRGARSVELTPEGRVLLRHAETISSQLAAARHDLGSLLQGKRESLRIGTFETFGPHFLAETLRSCADGHGAVPVEVHRAPDGTSLLRLLEEGAVDLALAALPLARPALASRVIVRDGFVLVTRVDDPIAAKPYVELGALSGLRLICGDTVPSQAAFEASLAATDVHLRVVHAARARSTAAGARASGRRLRPRARCLGRTRRGAGGWCRSRRQHLHGRWRWPGIANEGSISQPSGSSRTPSRWAQRSRAGCGRGR